MEGEMKERDDRETLTYTEEQEEEGQRKSTL